MLLAIDIENIFPPGFAEVINISKISMLDSHSEPHLSFLVSLDHKDFRVPSGKSLSGGPFICSRRTLV